MTGIQAEGMGTTVRVPMADLVHYPGNARTHDLGAIAESLETHGLYRPVVVQASTMHVLAGNGTVEAARDVLGWTELDAYVVDVDDDAALRINLVDNQAQALGGTDAQALALQLEQLHGEYHGTGFTGQDLQALQHELDKIAQQAIEPDQDEDDLPEPKVLIAQDGDLWHMGDHRLVVGDSTKAETLQLLMGGELADAIWTDPPYGIDLWAGMDEAEAKLLNHRRDGKVVQNDGLEATLEVVAGALRQALPVTRGGAPMYVATASGKEHYPTVQVLLEGGMDLRQTLVWVKDRMSFSRQDYHYQHELLVYGFTPGGKGEGRKGRGGHRWYGTDNRVSVLEHDKPSRSEDHPTMKPVSLVVDMLRNSVKRGGRVLDMFAGSGTTMAACERLGAHARLVELDTGYANGILTRYQELTGHRPTRDGVAHDFSRT